MKHTCVFLFGIIALLFLCGCTDQGDGGLVPVNKTVSCSKPYMLSPSGNCCLDMDGNGLCDSTEATPQETTTTIASTEPLTSSTTLQSTCTDGLENGDETGVDCGGSCKPCRNMCELLINTTGVKPAARTMMLCLTTRDQTVYSGYNFSVMNSDEGIMIGAFDANGSLKRTPLLETRDMSVENIALRFIGRARKNSTTYVWLYAWVAEEGVACKVNSDCGAESVSGYTCVDNKALIKLFYTYKCISPGTIFSECKTQQNQAPLIICDESRRCVSGDDKCFPRECFDGIQTKDEEGLDCGGSCRPCHCFNGVQDAGEKGIDCEGDCKPCIGDYGRDTTAPVITMSSPVNAVYTTHRVNLNYDSNEPVSGCGYSVNGKPNITVMRNGTIYADKGLNSIILSCRDNAGNTGSVSSQFTVFLKETMACAQDNVTEAYSLYYDSVFFYIDTERELGVPEKCSRNVFDYAFTYLNDSDKHYRTYNGTNESSDANLSQQTQGVLGYDCRAQGNLEARYAVFEKTVERKTYSKAKTVLYFSQDTQVDQASSFWRIYAYESGTGMPRQDRYMDVPYKPVKSRCSEESAYYQEFDLSGILEGPTETIHLRMGFYSASVNPVVVINEAELFLEQASRR
jgi:hypothetical protein